MVPVDQTWQNVGFLCVVVVWVGIGVALILRTFAQQFAYLRRFPSVDGIPLDNFIDPLSSRRAIRAQWRAMREPQSDPELEAMRHEVYRRRRVFIVWNFTFPFLCFCAYVLLFSTGVLRSVR